MRFKSAILTSLFVISTTGCTHPVHSQDLSIHQNGQEIQAEGTQSNQGPFSNSDSLICQKIEQSYKNNEIKSIVITNADAKEGQLIDINNDGIPEKMGYMPTRSYMALVEISDDRNIGIPAESPTAQYSGADVVQVGDKNYILHYTQSGPYELTEVGDFLPSNTDHPYQLKTLCKFYK